MMQSFNIPAGETPEQAKQRIQQQQLQFATRPPTDIGSGMQAVAQALMARQAEQQGAFPAVPGGGAVSPMQNIRNRFGLGGGLY